MIKKPRNRQEPALKAVPLWVPRFFFDKMFWKKESIIDWPQGRKLNIIKKKCDFLIFHVEVKSKNLDRNFGKNSTF